MQASGILLLVGILIPVGDHEPLFANAPRSFAIFWIVILFTILWIVVLVAADAAATFAHGRATVARIRRKRESLENRLKLHRAGPNGQE